MTLSKNKFFGLRVILLLGCLSICCLKALAQESKPEPLLPVIPPSPEAMAFQIYGDYPVSHYTGLPDISIPFYSIYVDEVQIPIQLAYHASGIKVDQTATWVGLGWSLISGGVITRTVNGIPDEDPYGILDKIKGYGLYYPTLDDINYSESGLLLEVPQPETRYLMAVRDKGRDSESDFYSLNVNGLSTKFILDPDGNAHCLPNSNIKIIRNGTNSWKVYDEEGTTYLFEKAEYSGSIKRTDRSDPATPSSIDGALPHITGWYLTKIITLKGNTIDFNYQNNGSSVSFSSSESAAYLPLAKLNQFHTDRFKSFIEYRITYTVPVLSSISFPNGKINFKLREESRKDVPGQAHPLEYIEIVGKNDELLKKFQLTYDYFISDDYHCPGCDIWFYKRLRLLSVQEQAADGKTIAPYTFDYYNTVKLPGLFSYDKDHWGFYNGKNFNTEREFKLIPSKGYLDSPSGISFEYFGANREPKFPEMMAWTLTEINYPTGGFSKFEYEAHDYYDSQKNSNVTAGGLRIKRICSQESTSSIPKFKEYRYRRKFFPAHSSALYHHNFMYFKKYAFSVGLPCDVPCTNPAIKYDGDGLFIDLQPISEIFSSSSLNGLGMTKGASVGYQRIEEWEGYKQGTEYVYNNGHNEYGYSPPTGSSYIKQVELSGFINIRNLNTTYFKAHIFWMEPYFYPIIQPETKDWEEGLLMGKASYDADGNIISSFQNYYSSGINPKQIGVGLKVESCPYVISEENHFLNNVIYHAYSINSDRTRLDSTIRTFYSNGNELSETTRYVYNEDYIKVKTLSTIDSKGEEIIENKYYPFDLSGEVYSSMVTDNYLPLVRSIKSKAGKDIAGKEIQFRKGEKITDSNRHRYPVDLISVLYGGEWQAQVKFEKYDSNANLLQQRLDNNYPISYLWGYNNTLPIAKIENATHDQVLTALNSSDNEVLYLQNYSDEQLQIEMDKIRDNLNNAMVTSYTYRLLKGLTSQTDPNGATIYYEYDHFGRLKCIKDDKLNILKYYNYHYSRWFPGKISGKDWVYAGTSHEYSLPEIDLTNIEWQVSGDATILDGQGTNSVSIQFGSNNADISVRAIADNGEASEPSQKTVAVMPCEVPPSVGTINGKETISAGGTYTYSVNSLDGLYGYKWIVPDGAEIIEETAPPQGEFITATVRFGSSGGLVKVSAVNSGCNREGPVSSKNIILGDKPTPGKDGFKILGEAMICLHPVEPIGIQKTYNISSVSGADEITWTISPEIELIANNGNSITVEYPYTTIRGTQLTIQAVASNEYGSITTSLQINILEEPEYPGIVSGNRNVCPGSTYEYSIEPVDNAISYEWTAPSNTTILEGQGTTDVQIKWGSTGGLLKVKSKSECASSDGRYLDVDMITPILKDITGFSAVCPNSTHTYHVNAIPGAANYEWGVPPGAAIISGHGTESISVRYGTEGGNIKVRTTTICGATGNYSIKPVSIIQAPIAGTISGESSVKANSTHTYSIVPLNGNAINMIYDWQVPSGATVVSQTHPPPGEFVTATVKFGSSSGKIKVRAKDIDACGLFGPFSPALPVSVGQPPPPPGPNPPGPISGPSSITIWGTGTTVTFSIAPVTEASSYTWVVDGENETVISSGQGTTSAKIYFPHPTQFIYPHEYGSSVKVKVRANNSGGGSSSYTTKTVAIEIM